MREALSRCWAPLVARLPDPRRVPVRRQATAAIVASAILHLLVFFVAAYFLAAGAKRIEFAKLKPRLKPLEIEILPMEPEPEPPQTFTLEKQQIEYLDSTGLTESPDPADVPIFESDRNMVARSLLAATGKTPMPSQNGRAGMPFTNFKNQHALLGPTMEAFPADVAIATAPAPPPPLYKPQPIPAEKSPDTADAKPPDKTNADPTPAPPEKPVPMKTVDVPKDDEFAFPPDKMEAPAPIAPPLKPRPSQELAKTVPPAPRPSQPSEGGYQPNQEQTKIEGSISNRGAPGVDAVRTPLGTFKKQISEAIGSRWQYYVKQHGDIITTGVTRVTFFVTKDARIQDVRVINNTSNESFAQICSQSVREAELASAPADAFDVMKDGRLEITFTFTLY